MRFIALALSLMIPAGALAQEATSEDLVPGVPFKDGDVITFDQLDKLKNYLPPEFWENREFFFYEGMELTIGPSYREYGAADAFVETSEKFKGQTTLGRDGALVGYKGGLPFHDIDCKGDPDAGVKIIWNFNKAWNGDGAKSNWSYTYWDRGEQLPLYYEGKAKIVAMAYRPEPQYRDNPEQEGNIFKKDKRQNVFGIEVDAPFDARGIMLLTYRYKSADQALDDAKNDDTWVYLPSLRRTRRISTAQRTDSVQGTDFTMDDLRSFSGIPPQYTWECLGKAKVVAPMNAQHMAYPYTEDYNFGPYGFSYANDQWELRDAWVIRFDPKNDDHPYHHKDIYIDAEAYEPLYSFAYDRKEELWKIIWHNHRYSEDWKTGDTRSKSGEWYAGWEGVEEPKDLRVISDIIVNVQTGTGNRIEFWDSHGTPLPTRGKIRKYIDLGRLNKGR